MYVERIVQKCKKCGQMMPGFIVNNQYFACPNCVHPVVINRCKRAWEKQYLYYVQMDYHER